MPVIKGRTDLPMRYQPDSGAFVITNGTERFNRPLYIGHDGARLDAGDVPEFMFYLPGKGGILRLGIATSDGTKWLDEAETIIARYIDGMMIYELSDSLLGDGKLTITAVPAAETTAALVRVVLDSGEPVELIWAYGGATGKRDFRGDIGYKDIVKHYELNPKECSGNRFKLKKNSFVLHGDKFSVKGFVSSPSTMRTADANQWDNLKTLLISEPGDAPVLIGRSALKPGNAFLLALCRGNADPLKAPSLAAAFDAGAKAKQAVATRLEIQTPDPYLNAAMPALCIAGDGLWNGSKWYMHGNVAWRTALIGWRCLYTGDALGWPERTRRHLRTSFAKQVIDKTNGPLPIEKDSDGWLSASHYDMNLIAFDGLLRHLLWTGDLGYARKVWPTFQRHLAWEKRCFDREGLYDALPAVWASDALQYNGGGTAHTSAYNYYANKMAARIAKLIGEDATPYAAEAKRIHNAMQKQLWLADHGWYAEYRDTLGLKQVHPSAALWSVYHTIDSEVPDPWQAWQMGRYVQKGIPQIPVEGPGVPKGDFTILPLSNWMPYSWSINNTTAEENYHTALACWQAQRPEHAWRLFKGTMLENMYRGICPGNAGMTLSFCAYRGESIRDFGDTIGILSRTIVEGLFGVVPNALSGEVTIRPGWPQDWENVSFKHPSIEYSFKRTGRQDRYVIEPKFGKSMRVKLIVDARGSAVKVQVNGKPAEVANIDDSIGQPRVSIVAEAAGKTEIVLRWQGKSPSSISTAGVIAIGEKLNVSTGRAKLQEVFDPQQSLINIEKSDRGFSAVLNENSGHHTVFARVKEGNWTWWMPVEFETRPALEIVTDYDGRATPRDESGRLQFRLRNNTASKIKGQSRVMVGNWSSTVKLTVPAMGVSDEMSIAPDGLLPGRHTVRVDATGKVAEGLVVNWGVGIDPAICRSVDLTGAYNDRVTDIFKQGKYTSPKRPEVSLGVPDWGHGNWCSVVHGEFEKCPKINDTGLRDAAGENDGKLVMECGVPFQVPVEQSEKNIAFVSQWDTFENELSVPLKGQGRHLYLLMAGSTYHMQSRFDNGEVTVTYEDGSKTSLVLRNPETWWPIQEDYFIDDYAFKIEAPRPPRVRLDNGKDYYGDTKNACPKDGAATVLDLPLDSSKKLKSLTVRAMANDVVIGLMSLTLAK